MWKIRNRYKALLKKPEEKKILGVDGRILLECILKQYRVSV
jgi:hypothetical protein